MSFTRCFSRQKRQGPKLPMIIGAIDLETNGFEGEMLYGTVAIDGDSFDEVQCFRNIESLLSYVFSLDVKTLRRTIWYSHNGEFDWRYFSSYFKKYKELYTLEGCERMEGKFYQIIVKDREGRKITTFRDSMALYPYSLKDFTKSFAPNRVKEDIGLDRGIVFDPNNPSHVDYAKNDVYALIIALKAFDIELYNTFGVHIRGTTASTAFQACLRMLPNNESYWRVSKQIEDWFRRSYYGGRVQLNAHNRKYDCIISSFDINSSYPAQMRKGVPYGTPEEVYEGQYVKGKPGFYRCTVSIPDNLELPPIPHKNSNGVLSFPTGVFHTYLSSIELDYLSEIGGTFVTHGGYYFPLGLCYPFADFVDICEATRSKFKGTPTEGVVKLIQNSLYGKFGTRPDGRKICIHYGGKPPEGFSPVVNKDSPNQEVVPDIYFMAEERDACYMLPHWSAWITANARLELDRYIRIAGAENVLYVDTDSVKTTPAGGANIVGAQGCIGKVYGQLKHEGDFAEFRVHAPKCYTAYVAKNGEKTEDTYCVVKGLPKKVLKKDKKYFLAIHNGKSVSVSYDSPTSYQTYARIEKFQVKRTRSSTNFQNVYGHILEDGRFRARRALPKDLIPCQHSSDRISSD
jgi:DNA polymerase type B, organellar and viral